MRLILIRHGETEENAGNMVQGHIHGRLSDLGREQAIAVGEHLRTEVIDAVYSSDLDRAYITAQLAGGGEAGRFSIVPDIRLREQSFGIFEGKPLSVLLQEMEKEGTDWVTFDPAGGESRAGLRARARAFLDDIIPRHDGQTVAVFTHYGMINSLLHLLSAPDKTLRDHEIANGSITIFKMDGSVGRPELINGIAHLSVSA